jgi:hypothetical protein
MPTIIRTPYRAKSANTARKVAALSLIGVLAAVFALTGCATDSQSPTAVLAAADSSASVKNPVRGLKTATVSSPVGVTDLAIASATDTSLSITFTQVSGGDGAAANYEVRSMTGPITWWLAPAVTKGTCASPVAGTMIGTKMTCSITGLAKATTYGVQLVSYRGVLNVNAVFGALSNAITGTTAAEPPPPPPPPVTNPAAVTDLAVIASTDTSLTLSFTQVTNGAQAPANYELRGMAGPITWWNATPVTKGSCTSPIIGTAIGTKITCTVTGLTASSAYGFQMVAYRGTLNVNAVFGALSNTASGTTAAPPPPPAAPAGGSASLFWDENFENTSFGSRGWYDNTSAQTSTSVYAPGSTRSLMYRWTPGASTPANGAAMRKKFTASNSLYVSYDVKYSDNYVGSNKSYHPHEFYVLSNMDGDWDGLSNNWMTLYIEQNYSSGGRPRLAMQDNKAINTSLGAPPYNLVGITENRSTAGCNGMAETGMQSECWAFAPWYNLKQVTGPVAFQPSAGAGYKGNWNRVEVYFQLNTVVNGIGQKDGIMQYWFNGQLLIDRRDILFRTGARASLMLNQFVIAPYIGDGSPVDQTMWIDNLRLAARR